MLKLALPLIALAIALPATAQDDGGEKVNVVIVYGEDACPQSTGDEITVCARKDEGERFRIPDILREDPNSPQNQSWANRVKSFEYVGASGTDSCSPVGAGGFTGCTQQLVAAAYAEKASSSGVQAGKLIEEARAERLSRIDEEAAAVQSRVEEVEAELAARDARTSEAEASEAEDASDAAPPPLAVPPQ